jgi:hypothetical protein
MAPCCLRRGGQFKSADAIFSFSPHLVRNRHADCNPWKASRALFPATSHATIDSGENHES